MVADPETRSTDSRLGGIPRLLYYTNCSSNRGSPKGSDRRALALAICLHRRYCAAMTSITVRDVPTEVRDELAARAARAGRSLQEHLRTELIELASKPSVEEVLARARSRTRTTSSSLPAERILDHRDADRA